MSNISSVKCIAYQTIENKSLMGLADLMVNDLLLFKGCGHFLKNGKAGIGLPLKKFMYTFTETAVFIEKEDSEHFKALALEAIDKFNQDGKNV